MKPLPWSRASGFSGLMLSQCQCALIACVMIHSLPVHQWVGMIGHDVDVSGVQARRGIVATAVRIVVDIALLVIPEAH